MNKNKVVNDEIFYLLSCLLCFIVFELIIGVFDYFIYGQFTGDFIQATIASIIVSVIAMVIHLIFGMKK
ncbi:MAG: hypothetical protein ACTTIY_06910 [Haemophilus parainfluenzae]